jgi:hypothetical protein
MSYLKFQLEVELKENLKPAEYKRETELTASSVPIIALDGGAHAMFTSLEVSHGSNVSDVQLPSSSFGTFQTSKNTLTGPYYIRKVPSTDVASRSLTKTSNLNTAILTGEQAYLTTVTSAIPAGEYFGVASLPNFDKPRRRAFTFCMPIVSGIVDTGMPKYIPVGILNIDLRLELGLGPWEQAFKCVGRMYKDTMHIDPDAC